MSLRVLFAIVALVIFLPVAGYLRSAMADGETMGVCERYSQIVYGVAYQRDMGVPLEELANKVANALKSGKITPEQYSAIMEMLVMVYSSEASPETMRKMAERQCNMGRVRA